MAQNVTQLKEFNVGRKIFCGMGVTKVFARGRLYSTIGHIITELELVR